MCIDNFNNDFLYPLLDKLNKEKKTLLLMGIDRLVEKHAPLQNHTQKQVKTLCKTWITKGIQIAIHKRNKLQKLFLNSKDSNLKKSYKLEFKKYRNMIVSLTKRSKKNHFSSYFQDNIHNLKTIWQGNKLHNC